MMCVAAYRYRSLQDILERERTPRGTPRTRTVWSVSQTQNPYPSPNADRTRAQPSATLTALLPLGHRKGSLNWEVNAYERRLLCWSWPGRRIPR